MTKIAHPQPEPNESIDSYAARVLGPPPPSARREQLGRYLDDVDRLQRCAVTADLLLKQEASPETIRAVGAVVLELQDGLSDLQRRRTIIMPRIRHDDDKLDAAYELGVDAQGPIYNIEALLDVISKRIESGRDGHLIMICALCIAEMSKLRFALYGEDMGP